MLKLSKQFLGYYHRTCFRIFILTFLVLFFSMIAYSVQAADTVRNISEFTDLAAAINEMGSTPTTLVIDKTTTLNSTAVVPENIKLQITSSGRIEKSSNYTLTINGQFEAGLYQVFSGFAAGDVAGFALAAEIYPEWWGAKADDSTDCTLALQSAADSLTSGGKIKISNGTYRFANFNILHNGTNLEGSSWDSILATTLAPVGITDPAIWVRASNLAVKNLKVTWVTLPTALVAQNPINQNNTLSIGFSEIDPNNPATILITNVMVDNVYVYGGKTHGIGIGRSHNVTIQNSKVEYVYGTGIWGYYACSLSINNNYITNSKDDAIYVGGGGPDIWGPDDYSTNVMITNNHIYNAGAKGIGVGGNKGSIISDNLIDGTWAEGILANQDYGSGGDCYPVDITITRNELRRIFQNYGVGQYRTQDISTFTKSSKFGAIETVIKNKGVISDNVIYDNDSGLGSYNGSPTGNGIDYAGLWVTAEDLTVTGNTVYADFSTGFFVGNNNEGTNPAGETTPHVDSLTMTGNKLFMAPDEVYACLALYKVSGTISGNYFDCGSKTLASPWGKFLWALYSTNVNLTDNTILNFATEYDNWGGTSSGITFSNNSYIDLPPSAPGGLQVK